MKIHFQQTQSEPWREKRWVWFFALFAMTLTSLPYLVAFFKQGTDWHFTGFVFGLNDGNSYIAKMLTGTWGAWLFKTPYTAYQQDNTFFFIPYIMLGKLAVRPVPHDQLVLIYHLYRLVGGFLAIFATYDFISVFLSHVGWRRLATILAVLGGGFGWISIFGFRSLFSWNLPLETYSPEAFGFLSFYGLPHLVVARALLLWGLRDFLLTTVWFENKKKWLRVGCIWAGIGLFQPLYQGVGLLVIAFYLLITGSIEAFHWLRRYETKWTVWKKYALASLFIALCVLPIFAYTFLSLSFNPRLVGWTNQNIIESPMPLDYLLGYGVVLPFALLGVRLMIKEAPQNGWFLAGWLLFVLLITYAPLTAQRRFLEGFWVAISILAIYWISKTNPRLRQYYIGWLTLAFPITLLLLTAGILFALHPQKPLFRPDDEVKAFEFFALNARAGDVVLALDDSANSLPAWAPVRTLNGHGPESVNGSAIRKRISCFFSQECSEYERTILLQEFGIDYVFYGPDEQKYDNWDPGLSINLKPVFASGDFKIYQYQPNSLDE